MTRNGTTETLRSSGSSNGVRIRIGSADRVIPRGQHTYVIRYRTTRQIGFFADYDELYWNATGTGWTFPIDMAEARITLPEKVPFRQTAVYTGPQGGRARTPPSSSSSPAASCSAPRVRCRRATASPSRPPGRRAWSSRRPRRSSRVLARRTIAGWSSRWSGSRSLLAYYAFAWLRVGRDPPSGTIIPLFGPPDGMSPAAVRYVDRMAFDNRCFTAAIINLGVKGHLRIVEEDGNIDAAKARRQGRGRARGAGGDGAACFRGGGQRCCSSQTNHEPLGKAKTGLSEALTKAYLGKLFTNNYGWSGVGLLLAGR